MTVRRIAVLASLAFTLIVAVAISQPSRPAFASAPIYQALDSLKNLDSADFERVVGWARRGAPNVRSTSRRYEQAEAGIDALGSTQRWAILQWLTGNGRSALYAQGVSDYAIGSHRPGADYPVATPTPDPWRELKFATESLDEPATGPVKILSGFAGAKRDGTGVIACISFQNDAGQPATSVLVDFTMKDERGKTVGSLKLDRTGTFSTGIGIHSWSTYTAWRGGGGNRGYNDNCASRSPGVAALPIIDARFVTYAIRSVTFADGTTWKP